MPGLARLLNGDVRYYDTNIGQSPYPASSQIPLAGTEAKGSRGQVEHPEFTAGGGSSDARLKEALGKSVGRRIPRSGTQAHALPRSR